MKLVLHNSDGEVIKEMPYGKTTNFDRITESPEKLAEWIFNDRVEQSDWWYMQCGHTVDEVLGWLKEESDAE